MPADGSWDLTRSLKGWSTNLPLYLHKHSYVTVTLNLRVTQIRLC